MASKERGNRWGEDVLCPLFVSYKENEIKCQSHVPECSSTVLKYGNVASCREQRMTFCEGCWKRCEHYLAWKHFRWDEEDDK